MQFREATARDWPTIETLLTACDLPLDGARDHPANFVLCEDGATLLGCAGAELYGDAALLRSVAVRSDTRGAGIGDKLTSLVLDRLRARNVKTVALLTTDAQSYFSKRGFCPVERSALPPALSNSAEMRGACPATAVAMVVHL